MEFVATGWCTGKWLRLNQTTKDLTFDDLEIPLVVIRLRVTGPKKTKFLRLLDLLVGRMEKGWCDLLYVERP